MEFVSVLFTNKEGVASKKLVIANDDIASIEFGNKKGISLCPYLADAVAN